MKNFYYNLKEYSIANQVEISESSLFSYIQSSVKRNPKLLDYVRYILFLDNSLEIDDICSDCYIRSLKTYNKLNNINVYDLMNILRDIITYNSVMKRKHFHEDLNEDILNTKTSVSNLDTKIIIEDCLNYLKSIDKVIEKCIRLYFLENKSYRSIAKEVKLHFNTVKWKIDVGLKLIENYKGLD